MSTKIWPNKKNWRLGIAKIVHDELTSSGFVKTADWTYARELASGIYGVLYIECRAPIIYQDASVVVITPRIGIIHEEIEKKFLELCPWQPPIERMPNDWTLWNYFYCFTGQSSSAESEIKFEEGMEGARKTIQKLVAEMASAGPHYWREFNSTLDFINTLLRDGAWLCQKEFKLPIALVLANRKQEAVDMVENCFKDMKRYRVNRQAYPEFYQAFMSWVRT